MNTLEAHDQACWNKFRRYAMEQDCFPGKLSCVWTSNRNNLLLPIPAFEDRSWLAQTRMEAHSQGAEVKLHNGNWYFVWPMP